jgi:hypothetical protein
MKEKIDHLQRRIAHLASDLRYVQSTIDRMEREKPCRRRSPIVSLIGWIVGIGVIASWGFAAERLDVSHFHAPFAVLDSQNHPIFVVKDRHSVGYKETGPNEFVTGDAVKDRGVFMIGDSGPIASMTWSTADQGVRVKAIMDGEFSTYAALGVLPGTHGFSVSRAGKQRVFAGGVGDESMVNVYAGARKTPLAQISSVNNKGAVSIFDAAFKTIARLEQSEKGGGGLALTDSAGETVVWAYGSAAGGDVCLWNARRAAQWCMGPQVSIAN